MKISNGTSNRFEVVFTIINHVIKVIDITTTAFGATMAFIIHQTPHILLLQASIHRLFM